MAVILFNFAESRSNSGRLLGVSPPFQGRLPLPATSWRITGTTKDAAGVALAGCTVKLFRSADDVEMDSTVSDGSGNFWFSVSNPTLYYVVAYKAGSPDVAGTTVNTLAGV